MSFATLVGHKQPLALLRRAVAQERLPSAYLFVGPPNIGKTLAAVELAKAVSCEQSSGGDSCDQCPTCRRIEQGAHPNFRLIRPLVKGLKDSSKQKNEAKEAGIGGPDSERDEAGQPEPQEYRQEDVPDVAGGLITIDQMRQLIASANLKTADGRRKTYVITAVETMNDEAANCLLRTLEEPPGPTTFILITANAAALLPTIISRCQIVNFRSVPREVALPALTQTWPEVEASTIEAVVAASGGRYGWAYRLLRSEQALAQRRAVLDLMASLPGRQLFEGMRTAESLVEAAEQWWLAPEDPRVAQVAKRLLKASRDNVLRSQMNELADVMFTWWRDLALLTTASRTVQVINADYLPELIRLAPNYDARACRRACRWVQETKTRLRGSANLRLSAEALMMKLISLSLTNA